MGRSRARGGRSIHDRVIYAKTRVELNQHATVVSKLLLLLLALRTRQGGRVYSDNSYTYEVAAMGVYRDQWAKRQRDIARWKRDRE
jgi:hypothetical protein